MESGACRKVYKKILDHLQNGMGLLKLCSMSKHLHLWLAVSEKDETLIWAMGQ